MDTVLVNGIGMLAQAKYWHRVNIFSCESSTTDNIILYSSTCVTTGGRQGGRGRRKDNGTFPSNTMW